MPDTYQIIATVRGTKKRIPVAGPFNEATARNWTASYSLKKSYTYFRVAKIKQQN